MAEITGTIFDVRRFTVSDGPGVRTTIFMKGCQLRCLWCHNPEGRDMQTIEISTENEEPKGGKTHEIKKIGSVYTVSELMQIILSEKKLYHETGGGVTFSGGEPLVQHQFLAEVLKQCQTEGVHTVIDTNGYADKEAFKEVMPFTSLFLFDLKHINHTKHLEFTSVGSSKILENLTFLLNEGATVWLRIPIIPGFNHNKKEIREIIETLKQLPGTIEHINLIPFHKTSAEKHLQLGFENRMKDASSLYPAQLNPYKRMFKRAGYSVSIGG